MLTKHRLPFAVAAIACSLASPVLSQTVTPRLAVYDADYKLVGDILDQNVIWVRMNDGDAALDVDAFGAFKPAPATFYYKAADCTGGAYMEAGALPTSGAFVPLPKLPGVISRGFLRYPKKPYETIAPLASMTSESKVCSQLTPGTKPILAGRAAAVRLEGYKPPLITR